MEDRLKELVALGKDNPFLGEGDDEGTDDYGFMDEFFKKCDMIRTGVEDMRTKVNDLREIYDESLGNVAKNKKKQGKEMEDVMDNTNATAGRLRDELQKMGKEIPLEADGLMTEDRIKKKHSHIPSRRFYGFDARLPKHPKQTQRRNA